jgi:hypothetical protein
LVSRRHIIQMIFGCGIGTWSYFGYAKAAILRSSIGSLDKSAPEARALRRENCTYVQYVRALIEEDRSIGGGTFPCPLCGNRITFDPVGTVVAVSFDDVDGADQNEGD